MDLKGLRSEIDSIDSQIVKLFEQRMDAVSKVAEYKKQNNLPVQNNKREEEILQRVSSMVCNRNSKHVKTLFQSIFSITRAYEEEIIDRG